MDRYLTSNLPGPSTARSENEIANEAASRPVEDNGPLQLFSDKSNLSPDGFCFNTGLHWVYPVNYSERKYQLDIVRTALFQNTLVCLPTGLGKTFIAAVVMFNFYRWFPNKKIIFMAPTKPLVAQQVRACYDIIGIPKSDTAELTGTTIPLNKRQEEWRLKRIFFATPQVVANDLVAQICPAADICCVVFDEAHRAKGNHSYCQVMGALRSYNCEFRVLALSATPGSDKESIIEVLKNLSISKLKLLTDESPEVKQYSHKKDVEVITVGSNNRYKEMSGKLLNILSRFLVKLMQKGVVPRSCNISNLSFFQLKIYFDKLNTTPLPGVGAMELNDLRHQCLVAMNLSKAYEMLLSYGKGAFLNYISQTKAESTNKLLVYTLEHDEDLKTLIMDLESIAFDHPKLQKLEELLLMHFLEAEDNCEDTKVIIFTEYRSSVSEIKDFIGKHSPLIRPVAFVGQSKKGGIGLTQQEQKRIMLDFKSNKVNTLVSTCVGEEGLDIGEVDLIVCYDTNKSPIRLVQRMGRTGRKRDGRVVILLTEGKEYQKYLSSIKLHSNVNKNIGNWNVIPIMNLLSSPRMVPRGVNPELFRKVLVIEKENLNDFFKKKSKDVPNGSELCPAISAIATINKLASTWQNPIPEFSYFDSLNVSEMLTMQPFDQMMTNIQEPEDTNYTSKFNPYNWTEWLTSLQGTSSSPHSLASTNLVDLMKFANRLNENDESCFTQSTEIASEAANDLTYWSNKLSKEVGGKKAVKGKKSAPQNQPSVANMLKQKKARKTAPPLFNDNEDHLFVEPALPQRFINTEVQSKQKKLSIQDEIKLVVENLSLLHLLAPLKSENPLGKMMENVCEVANVIDLEEKPDFDFEPPDISILDHIFSDMNIQNTNVEVTVKQPEISITRDTFVKKLRTTPIRRSATKMKPKIPQVDSPLVSTNQNLLKKSPKTNEAPVKIEFNFDLDICSDSISKDQDEGVQAIEEEVKEEIEIRESNKSSSQETVMSDDLLLAAVAELETEAKIATATLQATSTPKVETKFASKSLFAVPADIVVSDEDDFDDDELLKHCEELETKVVQQSQQAKLLSPIVEDFDNDDVTFIDEDVLEQVSAIEKQQTNLKESSKEKQDEMVVLSSSDDSKEDDKSLLPVKKTVKPVVFSDDDFVEVSAHLSTNQSVASKRSQSVLGASSDFERPAKRAKRKGKKRNPFALTQASMSGDDSSDDENTQMDQYDKSFIQEQFTQAGVDIHAVYLKTTRSPPVHPKFKIPELLTRNRSSDEAYLEDSFCVESDGSYEESEEDILEACEKRLKEKKKSKNCGDAKRKKKTRRIIAPVSSDSETEDKKQEKSNLEGSHTIPPKAFTPKASTSKTTSNILPDKVLIEREQIPKKKPAPQDAADQMELKPLAVNLKHGQQGSHKAPPRTFTPLVATSNSMSNNWLNKRLIDKEQRAVNLQDIPITVHTIQPKNSLPIASTSKSTSINTPITRLPDKEQIPEKKLPQAKEGPKPVLKAQVKPSFQSRTNLPEKPQPGPSLMPKLSNPEENKKVNAAKLSIPKPPTTASKINIIVATTQIQRAPQLVTLLSTKHNLQVIIRTLPPGIDYVLSQRLAVSRIRVSDSSSYFPNSKLSETIKSLNDNFPFVLLIFENDKDCPLPDIKQDFRMANTSLPGNKLRKTLCFLQESKTKYIFCRNQEETADYIAMVNSKESRAETYRIDDWFADGEEASSHFQFFSNLPHVNIVMALKLTKRFSSMNDFFNRCNNAEDVMEIMQMSESERSKANDIYRVLNEPWN